MTEFVLSQDVSLTLNAGSLGDLEQSKDAPGPTATLILQQITQVPHSWWAAIGITKSKRKSAKSSRVLQEGRLWCCRMFSFGVSKQDSLLHLVIIIYSQSKQATASSDFGLSDLKLGSFCTLFQAEIKRFGCWSPNLGSCWKSWTKVPLTALLPNHK